MGFEGFEKVKLRRPQRSTFDLSHDKRLTVQMGYLYPVLVQEAVPSDSFRGSSELLVRLAPLLAPLYDQIQVYVHYFFVPNRLLWDEWETFITGGQYGPNDPEVTAPPVVPQFSVQQALTANPLQFMKSRLSDYLGVPLLQDLPNAPDPEDFTDCWLDCLPYCAYQKIWYDYYRDPNLVPDDVFSSVALPIPSGDMVDGDWYDQMIDFRSRSYRHDYFRSALVSPQRGAEVMIPSTVNYLTLSRIREGDGDLPSGNGLDSNVSGQLILEGGVPGRLENLDTIGPLVNDFRSAYALQVWLERNAVGGARYTESIQAHFGVRPQDSRLQRAEYIGGGMVPVKISEVVALANSLNADDETVPQGNMAGHGIAHGNTNNFEFFVPEHGFIMGILSIINPPSYHQGLPRMFKRRSFLDYPWPTFAKLGEQQVDDVEIYVTPDSLVEDTNGELPNFGYQSRYADWKYVPNTLHGDFKDTLLFWTFARVFDTGGPTLGSLFVNFDPDVAERVFAVPSNPAQFWIYLHNTCEVKRALPYFGMPNTLGFS